MNSIRREFFNKKNVVQGGWAILVALVSFTGGWVCDLFKGPSQVVMTNGRPYADTVIFRFSAETGRDSVLSGLLTSSTRADDRMSAKQQVPRETIESANKIQLTPFKLPDVVGGYTQRGMDMIAMAECPERYQAKGNLIQCRFTLLGSISRDKLSPVMLSVRARGSTERRFTAVFSQQYELRNGENNIIFAAGFPPGTYQIVYGVYRLDEVNTKFPPFYNRSCDIVIDSM